MNQPKFMFRYFSQVQNCDVFDRGDTFVGRLYDIIMGQGEVYPKATQLILVQGLFRRRYATIPWKNVKGLLRNNLQLSIPSAELQFTKLTNNREELALRRDVLDQQVVDTNNHNVIRVNDIHMLIVENDWMLAHVDIGARGFIRRLGFEKLVDVLVKFFNKKAAYLQLEKLVSWKSTQPLSINPVSKTLKLSLSQKQLGDIHPADLSEIMLDLDHQHRLAMFRMLDLDTKSALFAHMDLPEQKSILDGLAEQEAAAVISKMPSDEAADLLDDLLPENAEKLLSLMQSPQSKKLSMLLGYESESAGGLMTTEYFSITQDVTVGQAIEVMKRDLSKPETVNMMYVVDEKGQLVGVTNLRRLLGHDPVDNIMKAKLRKTIHIDVEDSIKEVALKMTKYKLNVLPVLNKEKIMQGIITGDDILDRLISIAWRRWRKKNPTL